MYSSSGSPSSSSASSSRSPSPSSSSSSGRDDDIPYGYGYGRAYAPEPPLAPVASTSATAKPRGLTLKLPSLSALKAQAAAAQAAQQVQDVPAKRPPKKRKSQFTEKKKPNRTPGGAKPPRPVKLKPLREVLRRLVDQLKKKDAYAFFLQPVNAARVPGYANMIKRPMDFGTMGIKVEKGKYRSLEEFADDFRLVTNNAKTFNPAGSIFHSEAERIETWGLAQISKAAGTVIEYETQWDIDVVRVDENENDESAPDLPLDDDGRASVSLSVDNDLDLAVAMELGGARASRNRSTSVSTPVQGSMPFGRRTQRAAAVAAASATASGPAPSKVPQKPVINASMEEDGRLPGSRDGIGAFPPGSDWAQRMLQIKLKGRKITKRARLKMEKEGPPTLADGSLDYTGLEDPFSVLSSLLPGEPAKPALIPLFPTQPLPPSMQPPKPDQEADMDEEPSHPLVFSEPTSLHIPSSTPVPFSFPSSVRTTTAKKRRHWTVVRNVSLRGKARDEYLASGYAEFGMGLGVAQQDREPPPPWKAPRDPHATDFGSFGDLGPRLARELGVSVDAQSMHMRFGSEGGMFAALKATMEPVQEQARSNAAVPGVRGGEGKVSPFWTPAGALEAERFLLHAVYGGIDGLAYIRSVQEFVSPVELDYSEALETIESDDEDIIMKTEDDEEQLHLPEDEDVKPILNEFKEVNKASTPPKQLGMPLATWVQQHVLDPLTEDHHVHLREAASQLHHRASPTNPSPAHASVAVQIERSLVDYPALAEELVRAATLLSPTQPIEIDALLRAPEELYEAEIEWVGSASKAMERAMEEDGIVVVDKHAQEAAAIPAALALGVRTIREMEMERRARSALGGTPSTGTKCLDMMDVDGVVGGMLEEHMLEPQEKEEEQRVRQLRMNLLALAKRLPIDKIARLPESLVPEQLRPVVPTKPASTY